ncbi:hypothetical protein GOP47_0015102 [Adiantum capillus-veneris]|uniref:RING-type E3 ubiquitin transferase n=1 Tax=Adiantum capillus-veneris TaxID=13818 RepID=A0A9D4UMR4_ADICA|nr:hypothetical protein GOP47_0015102 [Adiantum capillus-veneris]
MANSSRRRRRHFGQTLMPPLNPSAISLVKSLIGLANDITEAVPAEGRKLRRVAIAASQKRNVSAMTRRIKILLMLFEEVRDTASLLPPSAILCFGELHVVLQGVKLLLEDCFESSRMCLLMEHHRLSEGFHRLTQSMATALEILPMTLLDVSCEVQEQVELVQQQAGKAQMFVDPNEPKLWLEVQALMAQIERKETPDMVKLMEVFSSLDLNSAGDCQRELAKLEEEVEGAWEASEEIKFPYNDLASFVRYGKCVLYGATELQEEEVREVSVEQSECDDVKVPEDFRCPISLELMTDPVIVATGQTYERAAITRWIEEGHQTCPKSGLMMAHTVLIPNQALRSLIWQWCERHGISISPSEPTHQGSRISQSTPTSLEATKLTVEFLLRQLPSAAAETQRHIAGELRLLAKCGSDNRKVIADAEAVPLLLPLLSARDVRTQEHAVTAILNLSIFPPNKAIIVEAGAVDYLIKILCSSDTSDAARENSAAALFSLSHVTDYAALLGEKAEAISGLLQLLRQGSLRGRRDAASALFNISAYSGNRAKLVKAGAVGVLLGLLSPPDSGVGLQDEALAVLAVLAGSPEGRVAIADLNAVPLLVELLRSSSPKGKENAVAILLNLCRYVGQSVIKEIMNVYAIWPSLHSLLNNGTARARRKASSLLRMLRKWEASPITLLANYC